MARYGLSESVKRKDSRKFDELIAIYSDDIESHSNDGSVSHGKEELIKNTKAF